MDIKTVCLLDSNYPALLKHIPDPPGILYYIGDLTLASKPSISIVGSRKATAYGKWASYTLAQKLSLHQIVVVSGMASGVDSFSHKGALESGGKTIAVMGCGLDLCYPSSNRILMEKIRETGLLLSEYPPGTPPLAFHFPQRNRIISGLSQGTVIIEAGLSSGSLITAVCAADQGRNIYAIPGNINSAYSLGSNQLIRDGVTPLVVLDDLIEDLGLERARATEEEIQQLGAEESRLYQIVRNHGEVTGDMLCKLMGKMPGQINALITVLEIKGYLHSAQGKIFIAK